MQGIGKGKTNNPNGRPIGTPNKLTSELRPLIQEFLSSNYLQFVNDFNSLAPDKRVKVYCDILQFGIPKMRDLDHKIKHYEK